VQAASGRGGGEERVISLPSSEKKKKKKKKEERIKEEIERKESKDVHRGKTGEKDEPLPSIRGKKESDDALTEILEKPIWKKTRGRNAVPNYLLRKKKGKKSAHHGLQNMRRKK